jgi:hypothetical protein
LQDEESDPTIQAAKELGMDLSLLAIMTPGIRGGTEFSIKSLKFVLDHPGDRPSLGPAIIPRFSKSTASSRQFASARRKKEVKSEVKHRAHDTPTAEGRQLAKIEHVLARMKERLLRVDAQIRKLNCLPTAGPKDHPEQ